MFHINYFSFVRKNNINKNKKLLSTSTKTCNTHLCFVLIAEWKLFIFVRSFEYSVKVNRTLNVRTLKRFGYFVLLLVFVFITAI